VRRRNEGITLLQYLLLVHIRGHPGLNLRRPRNTAARWQQRLRERIL